MNGFLIYKIFKMKEAKNLIRLRLRCLINGDFTFEETVQDLYSDLQNSTVFNFRNFMVGFVLGNVVAILVFSHLITK